MIQLFSRFRRQSRPSSPDEAILPSDEESAGGLTLLKVEAPTPINPAGLTRVQQGQATITRVYEDSTLHPMEEKRADSDRVIAYLQATGALTSGALNRARRLWRATGRQDRLWRVLLRTEELAEDDVYEAAATAYGFLPVEVSLLETVGLIGHLSKSWPDTVMPRLIGLGILPVIPSESSRRKDSLTFAAYDPTRAEVRRMVETVATGTHSIRYLSRSGIDQCIKAVSDFLPNALPKSIRTIGTPGKDSDDTLRRAA